MATPFDAKNPALFEVPVPPQEFGQDGGKFYHYYDTLADEIDDNMVAGLKEQLDGLLIFAGLFAGVNSAFLALTLPLMSPDPADDTNALLRDNNAILLNIMLGRNDSLTSTKALPSETFSPAGKILTVNVLFSVSLTFALLSSFLAVLGRQWLVYYRKRTGGGPERQRWEQLKRFLGAERWRLEGVLDDVLPSLLQIGLIIFCISLTIYLNTLHPMLSNIVGAFMCAGVAILIVTAIFAIWDKFCPFQSPLSHFILLVSRKGGLFIIPLLRIILSPFSWIAVVLSLCFVHGPGSVRRVRTSREVKRLLDRYLVIPIRKEETDGTLQITAIRRAICTSDDARTQAHAVSNILSITDAGLLMRLATDEEFDDRISELCTNSHNRTLQLCGRGQTNLAVATSWLYRAAITHIFLSTVTPDQQLTDKQWERVLCGTLDMPSLSLSPDPIQNANPNMTIACLGFMALFTRTSQIQTRVHRLKLRCAIDGLVNPSWKCISMIPNVIMLHWLWYQKYTWEEYPRDSGRYIIGREVQKVLGDAHESWIGKPSTVLQNLKSLLKIINDPECEDRDLLTECVVDIFKLAGKAAADSGGDSSRSQTMAAGFLRFSEGLVRGKDSPSNLINAGRSLRAELIGALSLECEKLPWPRNYALEETLKELCQLFTDLAARLGLPVCGSHSTAEQPVEVLRRRSPYLVAVGGRPMTTSNQDDDELVYLFSSPLQKLNILTSTLDDWGGFMTTEDDDEFVRQVKELNASFASFKAAVESVSQAIKRRKRDPDIGWCCYDEEAECKPRVWLESQGEVERRPV